MHLHSKNWRTHIQRGVWPIDTLKAAGAGTIFREKVSGARADRPQLAKLTAGLKAGDVVVVTKLDRLGRSTRELLDLIDRIGKAGASFRSLGDPLWDTSSAQGRLLSTLLASIAEFERELIRERTGEGRNRAMAAGVKFGRKRKLSDYQRAKAIKHRAAGETLASIAKSYGVHLVMISRLWSEDAGSGVASRERSGHWSGRSPSQQWMKPEPPHSGHGRTSNPSAM
jgi:DNA invertase Pin-like site-specific DNA recombinase